MFEFRVSAETSPSSIFPHTDWSRLNQAANADALHLDKLIRLYWAPLRIYFVASFPSLKEQAEVVLQEFAEDKILKEGWLKKADPARGKFRDFLKTSLRNFVLDRLNRAEVRHAPLSLDELGVDLPAPAAANEAFDLTWVRAVLTETLQRMEADCRAPGLAQPRRSYIWEMFRVRLLEPILNQTEIISYEQLISRFDLKSPADASNLLLSGKRIFKAHLDRVIQEYAGHDAAAALELKDLETFLGRLAHSN